MQFRLLGFPVHVHPWFFLIVTFLGAQRGDLTLILVWVVVVFVSILAHELGHATVARAYGLQPSISLYSMGGMTQFAPGRRLTPAQNIAVSLAGPVAGFLLGGIAFLVSLRAPAAAPFVVHLVLRDLLWVNFGWGILNLLPILPLDGGNILRSSLHAIRPGTDERLPLKISISFGGLAFVAALTYDMLWAAGISALMTYGNYQSLSRLRGSR